MRHHHSSKKGTFSCDITGSTRKGSSTPISSISVAFVFSCFILATATLSAELSPLPIQFLETHCIDCHDDLTSEGDFRVDLLTANLADAENHEKWARVLARVQSGEMPPAKKKGQPDPGVRRKALQKLKLAFQKHAGETGPRVRTRRLNRLEYENTVRDLLSIDTPLKDLLPEDDLAEGFANNTGALSISPVHIQQYMAAADRALRDATVRQARPETTAYRFSYNHEVEKPFHGHAHNQLQCNLRGEDLHFFLPTHIEVPAYLRQFAAVTKYTPGRYRIKITTEALDTVDGEDLFYSVWLAAGGKRKQLLGYFDALFEKPASVELTHYFNWNETIIIAPWRMARIRADAGYSVYLPDKKEKIPEGWHAVRNPNPPIATVGPALVVKPVEITGPLHESWPPRGHRLLYGDVPLVPVQEVAGTARVPMSIRKPVRGYVSLSDPLTVQAHGENMAKAAKAQLSRFMSRAFRRPVGEAEVEKYFKLVEERLEQGECFEVAMNAAHRAVLCSPHFLFLVEEGPDLNDYELAARLAYFLWRTTPDQALIDLAARGDLAKPEVLRREANRLMNAPRFDAFIADFLDHWLNLREIEATTPDRDLFPEYFTHYQSGTQDTLLHRSIIDEPRAFFRDMIQRNLEVTTIVNSPHAFLNQRLAEHYDLPPVKGAKLRRVELPADSVRGGLLTQAGVLKVTANGANTSPVIRGVWLLEKILGTSAPPPPPDAGSIEPDTRGAKTIREKLALHKNSQSCAGCHQKIDPPGFALESFDPIGRYRHYYRTTETGEKLNEARTWFGTHYGHVKYLKGADIDTSAELPDGSAVSSIREYRAAIAKRSDLIARNLAQKLVTFATGAPAEPGDELAIDAILQNSESSGFGMRTLIHEVIQSKLFTRK